MARKQNKWMNSINSLTKPHPVQLPLTPISKSLTYWFFSISEKIKLFRTLFIVIQETLQTLTYYFTALIFHSSYNWSHRFGSYWAFFQNLNVGWPCLENNSVPTYPLEKRELLILPAGRPGNLTSSITLSNLQKYKLFIKEKFKTCHLRILSQLVKLF